MATFTVHAPPGTGPIDGAELLRFVSERPSFWALALPPVWLVANRLWLLLVAWVLCIAGLVWLRHLVIPTFAELAMAVFWVWFAASARDLQRWCLGLRGWTMVGLVDGRSAREAEHRFFRRLAEIEAPEADRPTSTGGTAEPGRNLIASRTDAVIGFEQMTGGRR